MSDNTSLYGLINATKEQLRPEMKACSCARKWYARVKNYQAPAA